MSGKDDELMYEFHTLRMQMPEGSYWTHYKGGVYKIITVACKEDTLEPIVVYQSLKNGSIWARTLQNWRERVQLEGKSVKRFQAGAP